MLAIGFAASLAGASPQTQSPPPPVCERVLERAEGQAPATIDAMKLIAAWLEAMRTQDDAGFVRLVKERGPALWGVPEDWLRLKDMLQGDTMCGVKSADAKNVELWMYEPNFDSFSIAYLKLPEAAGDKVTFAGIFLTGDVPPGFVRPAKLPPAELVKALQARLAEQAASDRFSGAVLIAKQGKILFEQARGFADREARRPNDLNTQFRFGSMGKMFTVIAIMQLVQDGKIDLAAPIGRYLPDYPNRDVATKVTVANLLTHTGGVGDIFGPEFAAHKATLRDLKDYVDLYGKRPLEFSPGSRFAYSNYGFVLLGRIVEVVSHGSYDAYIQRAIFDPTAMHSTGNLPEATILPHRAVAYMGSGANLKRADDTLPLRGTSAGGGYSTVGDLNKFADAVASHRLLRAETLRQLLSGGVKGTDGHFYPYDFGGTVEGAGPFFGHGGGAPGMSGMLHHFLDSGYTVIVLANRDPGTAEGIGSFVEHRLPGK